jgi:hypothetical protein
VVVSALDFPVVEKKQKREPPIYATATITTDPR